MVLIYSETITSRLDYIVKFIFEDILGTRVHLTTNSKEFRNSDLPKINYSLEKFNDELYLKPHRLLFAKAIYQPNLDTVWYNNEKYFFETSPDSFLPFDPFAASFYVVTRYEEYLEKEVDQYGRYPAKKSILFKNGLLQKPVVNIWANIVAEKLTERYPDFSPKLQPFKYLPTIDIDNAWAYLHKGFFRTTGALLQSLVQFRFKETNQRIKVLLKLRKDPFDTYDFIFETLEKFNGKAHIFFLIGDYGKYDKNIHYKNKSFIRLIQRAAKQFNVGVHPSYNSAKKGNTKKVGEEIIRLATITGNGITRSRQHFLKLKIPRTYKRLLKFGIKEDYTMGYASQIGFRAGTCTPFNFFNVRKEKTSELKIYPLHVMDVTLRDYIGLDAESAKKQIEQLMREVKKAGGTFVSLWHNETLGTLPHWKGYDEVFEFMSNLGFELENN